MAGNHLVVTQEATLELLNKRATMGDHGDAAKTNLEKFSENIFSP